MISPRDNKGEAMADDDWETEEDTVNEQAVRVVTRDYELQGSSTWPRDLRRKGLSRPQVPSLNERMGSYLGRGGTAANSSITAGDSSARIPSGSMISSTISYESCARANTGARATRTRKSGWRPGSVGCSPRAASSASASAPTRRTRSAGGSAFRGTRRPPFGPPLPSLLPHPSLPF